jgi:PAS domain S-box-containing protein
MELLKLSPDNRKKYYYIAAGICGLLALSLILILAILFEKQTISLKHLLLVQLQQPVLFLVWLLPPLFILVIRRHVDTIERIRGKYKDQIDRKDYIINRYAEFAKHIGQGNYDEDIKPENDQDILGKSLVVMRNNLRASHKKESDQNWISEGRNVISNILRMYNKLEELGDHVLVHLIRYVHGVQGAIYLFDEENNKLVSLSTYAYGRKKYITTEFPVGYGLIGQCAYEKDYIYLTEIPDYYYTISSGLIGDKKPRTLLLVPLISDEKLQGVIEIASLDESIPELTIRLVNELGNIIARTLFNLRINQQTVQLLEESQKMTLELKNNEDKLRDNAEAMRYTQEELKKSNEQLGSKIREVENAQARLHSLLENASEIIAIYDHELRITYISPSVLRILGYSPEEMMKGKDLERLSLHGQTDLKNLFKALIDNPEATLTIEYTFVRKDGEIVSLETTGRNLLGDDSVSGILLNSRDITERRRAEKEEYMRSRMQSLSENSLDLIIRLSTDGRFYYVNPVVEDYTGLRPKDLINKNLQEVSLPKVLNDYFTGVLDSLAQNQQKTNTELSIPIKVGEKTSERIMSIDAIPEGSGDMLETVLFVGHDITEAKRIQREIQVKNRKIEDSINYARRIQSSILPDAKHIKEYFPRSYIFYKPRDVISGDFPWFFVKKEHIFIAAVDCTGHGVPGALLSFVAYFLLNNLADHNRDYTAGELCDRLHTAVQYTLRQNMADAEARDGMDLSLCKIELDRGLLHYAGAHRPLYFIRNGELTEYKGEHKAIGGIPSKRKPEPPFTNHIIEYKKGDRIFFFSDGLPDQLGGPEEKKYSPKRIRDIILQNPGFTMNQFNNYFMEDFEAWIKDHRQIDDVLMIGIEF